MTDYVVDAPTYVIRDLQQNQTGTIHVIKGTTYGYPLWSQRDPRWVSVKLGFSSLTIGSHGCLITAIAMGLTAALDTEITPPLLNAQLKAVNGYLPGSGNLIYNKVTELYPNIPFIEMKTYITVPAPVIDIARWVTEEQIVVIQVDMDLTDPDVDEHWILITGGRSDLFTLHDPWAMPDFQKQFEMPPAYCKQGWTPARAIYAYARYGVPRG